VPVSAPSWHGLPTIAWHSAVAQFSPANDDRGGRLDAEPDLVSLNSDYRQDDIVADLNTLSSFTAKDEHVTTSLHQEC
jgi:hypothetical protein